MTRSEAPPGVRSQPLSRFVVASGGVAAGCAAIGYLPTVRLAGAGAAPGLFAGCAISWVAAIAGAVLFDRLAKARVPGGLAELAKLGLRFFTVVLAGAVGAIFARRGFWPLRPMLVWIALSYLPLLGLDIGLTLLSGASDAPSSEENETR